LYGTYLSVVPVVKYKQTPLNKLSLGQKATVLLKIYLAQGTNPIIIDSHDDHLDNEFIMEELVGAIREAKSYRQVILASNNGNVVINSDAEQIIVAQRDEGKISYLSGSIENPTIRERALRVLEGGADAFKKRQQKYRLEI
jgi:ABC-type cobalamin/Fe3+-siderophores transport system ATPase subunit